MGAGNLIFQALSQSGQNIARGLEKRETRIQQEQNELKRAKTIQSLLRQSPELTQSLGISEDTLNQASAGDLNDTFNALLSVQPLLQQQQEIEIKRQQAETSRLQAETAAEDLRLKSDPESFLNEIKKKELDLKIQGLKDKSGDDKLKSERELRNDFNKLAPIRNLRIAQTGAKKVAAIGGKVRKALNLPEGTELTNEQFKQALIDNPSLVSAADDLSMVFNFMKTLDPNSVVRESEFRTAADAKAWVDKNEDLANQPVVKAIFAKVLTGQRLLPAQKAEMIRSAKLNLDQQIKAASPTIRQYRNIEERGDFDKGFIVQDELAALLPSDEVVEETQATTVSPSEPIEISDTSELPAIIESSQPGQVIFLNGKPIGRVPSR